MAEERLVLVDRRDRPLGTGEKMAVHRAGQLHRALSVVVRDSAGRFLLQRRSAGKYHSAGLWTNTCCSHPRPGEDVLGAAHRRLEEEMGFDCPLGLCLTTRYFAHLDGGMSEHELVHVFTGSHDGPVRPAPSEVAEVAWIEPETLTADLRQRPQRYSVWFRKYVLEHWAALTRDLADPTTANPA